MAPSGWLLRSPSLAGPEATRGGDGSGVRGYGLTVVPTGVGLGGGPSGPVGNLFGFLPPLGTITRKQRR